MKIQRMCGGATLKGPPFRRVQNGFVLDWLGVGVWSTKRKRTGGYEYGTKVLIVSRKRLSAWPRAGVLYADKGAAPVLKTAPNKWKFISGLYVNSDHGHVMIQFRNFYKD